MNVEMDGNERATCRSVMELKKYTFKCMPWIEGNSIQILLSAKAEDPVDDDNGDEDDENDEEAYGDDVKDDGDESGKYEVDVGVSIFFCGGVEVSTNGDDGDLDLDRPTL